MKIKNILATLAFILINSGLNIGIYLYSYKKLTFPFLHEEQRMDNAPYIFTHVIPSFLVVSICTIVLFYYIKKKPL